MNSTNTNTRYLLEARMITKYLISKTSTTKEEQLYKDGVCKIIPTKNTYENLLLKETFSKKWKIGCIDSALAITDPYNIVRKKIFLMLAILESSPNHTHLFLPRKQGFNNLVNLIYIFFRWLLRVVIGLFLIKKIKRNCI